MSTDATETSGPVLFAYDGSDLAGHAITEAGRQLKDGQTAFVLTVWEPFNVGFLPIGGMAFDAAGADEVRSAAEKTAAHGASLAEEAGFRTETITAEGAPTWQAIVDTADARGASLIVLGSHGRSGVSGLVMGSVASAVAAHAQRSVLIVHHRH